MTFERQIAFWLAALAVIVLLLWLLSEILLPFVAGVAIAYLLDAGHRPARTPRRQPAGRRAVDHHVGGDGDRRR